ncbi:MAG: CHAP domain-containing protein [Intrasporangium sp.]|uniref:CHAP domain-containing protein n=1 Tax=Intrasporangium sp. TaxID=1925024 RepID=UPI0026497B4F|nr:CHAP domain-containing protein [Intrasporangium sp.]MDN5794796.1 CHAP domain-containing protein [Intrasporangium sp.]
MKSAATLAAAGGLIAAVAGPAAAETVSSATSGTVAQAVSVAPSAVGPDSGVTESANALAAIGYAAPKAKKPTTKPIVIEDLVVKDRRAKAAKAKAAAEAKAAAQARAARAAQAERASRSTTRSNRSGSTYSAKAGSNNAPAASSGIRSSRNWATPGQCTWGALNKWYQSEGYYPSGWTGNASGWAYGAASAGYTVSSVPRVRSIVVMQPGVHGSSSAGHVGWVTAVNGNRVTIVEMNALAGAYNYNTRTLTNVGGMRYIYAP